MRYFSDGYNHLKFPIAEGDTKGLRRAQIGAIHAIGAYFSQPRNEPGLIVMPTGSGKTAVIGLSAFLLRAQRVLILTPSQLVRSQIAEEMSSLAVLKDIGVLTPMYGLPKVTEAKHRLTEIAAWEELRSADYVVSTPQCVSPGIEGVVAPPPDLFDLILMDEAHHSEAPRWADILQYFKNAKRLLFTATPFRRDKKELKGSVIYSYPLRLAHEDRIFGNLRFVPVTPTAGEDHDIAIAREAQRIYREDAAAGLQHRLMVRTDSKSRADDLARIYGEQTTLTLPVVHSGHSLKHIRKTLERLRAGEIDGVICVAMMGEGFDFPQLKIAAIHAPHKSLAVTLQFIGRFARTTGQNLGEAKFLAVPQDIQAETNELYRESAAWQDIVSNLSAARIERELRIKNVAASFTSVDPGGVDIADVVLTDFTPYFHVKIYQITDKPDFQTIPDFGRNVTVQRHEVSEEYNSAILLLRQVTKPRWTDMEQFARVETDLVVLYYDEATNLLFINSSRRTLEFYLAFEEFYGKGTAKLIPGPRINRVLSGLENPDFFNIGLKNTVQNSNTESYQIKAGPSAQNAISPADGLLYRRGHIFGKGTDVAGESVTIGYSSSSKVWSNTSARVGELLEWCQTLASKLSTKGAVLTGTPLDTLEVGDEIDQLLAGVLGVGWPDNVFQTFPRVLIGGNQYQLLDIDIQIDYSASTDDEWIVILSHPAFAHPGRLSFTIAESRAEFKWVGEAVDLRVIRADDQMHLSDYLFHYPLAFYLEDFSRIDGTTISYNRNAAGLTMPGDALEKLDWKTAGVNIEKEFPNGDVNFQAPTTVQELLGRELIASTPDVVFYDHGTGEIADFLTFQERQTNELHIRLYHCKGAGGPAPGDRVADAYEVCGQIVKCLIWLKNKQQLRQQIIQRETSTNGKSRFLKGDRNDLLRLLGDNQPRKWDLEIVIVQPGIDTKALSEKMSHILGAASDYVRRAISAKMILMGS